MLFVFVIVVSIDVMVVGYVIILFEVDIVVVCLIIGVMMFVFS